MLKINKKQYDALVKDHEDRNNASKGPKGQNSQPVVKCPHSISQEERTAKKLELDEKIRKKQEEISDEQSYIDHINNDPTDDYIRGQKQDRAKVLENLENELKSLTDLQATIEAADKIDQAKREKLRREAEEKARNKELEDAELEYSRTAERLRQLEAAENEELGRTSEKFWARVRSIGLDKENKPGEKNHEFYMEAYRQKWRADSLISQKHEAAIRAARKSHDEAFMKRAELKRKNART